MGQKVISKWGRFNNFLFQSGTGVISKWVIVYVKVGQNLFESGQLLPSGEKCFFKVGQLFQSGKIISKSSLTLQSYDLGKSKTKLTFEINDVLKDDNEESLIPQNIFEQLDLYLKIQAMKNNVFDATTKEIKSNKEFWNFFEKKIKLKITILFYFPFFQITVVELYYFVKFGARLLNTGKKKDSSRFL